MGTAEERFWGNVTKTRKCWTYRHTGKRGYGKLLVNGKHLRANRFVWEITYGPIPAGMIICHHCDNPSCVRPSHLFVGTHADNMMDKIRKGRGGYCGPKQPVYGERHPNTILRNADIRKIRRLYAVGNISQQALGEIFSITQTAVSAIVRRKWWQHVV